MTESTRSSITIGKIFNNFKSGTYHGHKNHLRNPFPGLNGKSLASAIPARHVKLSLIIRVNKPDEVTQYDTVLVTQAGAR